MAVAEVAVVTNKDITKSILLFMVINLRYDSLVSVIQENKLHLELSRDTRKFEVENVKTVYINFQGIEGGP